MQKLFIGGMGFILCLLGGGISGFGREPSAPLGELRIVDANALNWASIALNIFDRLIELDPDGNLVPGLATEWRWLDDRTLEVKLRQGVRFQNGEGFDAEIVKRNWEAYTHLRQPQMSGEFMNFMPGSRLEVDDPSTLRLRFPEVDGAALVKLSRLHIASGRFLTGHGWGEKQWGIVNRAGPWGSGPYRLVDGFSTPQGRSERIILEANADHWDRSRLPRLQRIVFDNTLSHKDALERVKASEGLVDLVSELRPTEALSMTHSPFAKVVTKRGALVAVFGQFNTCKAGSPWRDVRLRRAINLAVSRDELIRDVKGHGVIIPAVAPEGAFGHDPTLAP